MEFLKGKKGKAILGVVVAITVALTAFGVDMPDWIMNLIGSVSETPAME